MNFLGGGGGVFRLDFLGERLSDPMISLERRASSDLILVLFLVRELRQNWMLKSAVKTSLEFLGILKLYYSMCTCRINLKKKKKYRAKCDEIPYPYYNFFFFGFSKKKKKKEKKKKKKKRIERGSKIRQQGNRLFGGQIFLAVWSRHLFSLRVLLLVIYAVGFCVYIIVLFLF